MEGNEDYYIVFDQEPSKIQGIKENDEIEIINYIPQNKIKDNNSQIDDLSNDVKNLKLYDSKVDTLFKLIFGEGNEKIAINFLNSILPNIEPIKEIYFLNTAINTLEVYKENERSIIVDVRAKSKNCNYLIEMQVHEEGDIVTRAEVCTSRMLNNLYSKGEALLLKEKIYSINLLYFDLYPEKKDYYHRLHMHKEGDEEVCSHVREIIIIELRKFRRHFKISDITIENNDDEIDLTEEDNNRNTNIIDLTEEESNSDTSMNNTLSSLTKKKIIH